ncbi:hypothetical protein ON010_g11082 [Phytophthora cinnamomi]|nr:hypothetical protein ON010_g11082 [Phytophthora cinnamomi]
MDIGGQNQAAMNANELCTAQHVNSAKAKASERVTLRDGGNGSTPSDSARKCVALGAVEALAHQNGFAVADSIAEGSVHTVPMRTNVEDKLSAD